MTLLDVRGDRVGRTTTSPPLPFPLPSFHLPRLADAAAAVIFSFSANLALRLRRRLLRERLDPPNFTASGPSPNRRTVLGDPDDDPLLPTLRRESFTDKPLRPLTSGPPKESSRMSEARGASGLSVNEV